MKQENLPAFEFSVVGVRHIDGEVEVRMRALMMGGDWRTLKSWRGPHGRLDAAQLDDACASVMEHLSDSVVTTWGVQTLLK